MELKQACNRSQLNKLKREDIDQLLKELKIPTDREETTHIKMGKVLKCYRRMFERGELFYRQEKKERRSKREKTIDRIVEPEKKEEFKPEPTGIAGIVESEEGELL